MEVKEETEEEMRWVNVSVKSECVRKQEERIIEGENILGGGGEEKTVSPQRAVSEKR